MVTSGCKGYIDFCARRDFFLREGETTTLMRFMSYLDELDIPYEVFLYEGVWDSTPSEVASALGLPRWEMVTTVLLNADDHFVMAVLPADGSVDLERIKEIFHAEEVHPATEEDLELLFPGYDADAIPPFGNLFGLPVCLDMVLLENDRIAFQVGRRGQILRMRLGDLTRLICPCLGDLRLRPLRMMATE